MKLVGSDTVDGGKLRRQGHDILLKLFSLFDGIDVEWFFDDENGGFIAVRITIEFGNLFVGVD